MKKSIFKKLAIIAPFAVAAVAMPIALTSCSETSQTTDDGNNEGSGSNNQDQTIDVDLSVVGSSINSTITSKVSEMNNQSNISSTQDSIKTTLNAIENMKDSVSSVSISLSNASVSNETNRTADVTVTFNNNVKISGTFDGLELSNNTISKKGIQTQIKGDLSIPVIETKTITITGSEDVLTNNNFNDYINKKLNETSTKNQILKDKLTNQDFTSEQLQNINLSIEPSSFTKSTWGNTQYEQWKDGQPEQPAGNAKVGKTPATIIVYNTDNNEKILLGGNGTDQRNLKEYLSDSENLKNIFDAAKGASTSKNGSESNTTTTVSLVESSNIGYTNDGLIHINVISSTTTTTPPAQGDGASGSGQQEKNTVTREKSVSQETQPTVEYYDLQIPVSCIGLQLDNSKLSVSGSNVVEQEISDFSFKFNIGNANIIDGSTVEYSNNNVKVENANTPTIDTVLKALGWGKDKTPAPVPGVPGASVYGEPQDSQTSNLDLISTKIGDDLNIFNTTFSDPQLNEIKPANGEQTSKTINPDGYTITLTATPNSGFCWDDGTNTPKKITTGKLDLRVSDAKAATNATLDTYTLFEKVSGGLTNETLKTYFEKQDNFNDFVTKVNEIAVEEGTGVGTKAATKQFENVDFTFKSVNVASTEETGPAGKTAPESVKNVQVVLSCSPKYGHSFSDGSIVAKDVTITITTLTNKEDAPAVPGGEGTNEDGQQNNQGSSSEQEHSQATTTLFFIKK